MRTNIILENPENHPEQSDGGNLGQPLLRRLREAGRIRDRVLFLPDTIRTLPDELLERMHDEMDRDPMLGFCCLGPLELEVPSISPLLRSSLSLIRSELLAEFLPAGDEADSSTETMLARFSLRANRVGYITRAFPSPLWSSERDPTRNDTLCETLSREFLGFSVAITAYRREQRVFEFHRSQGRPKVLLDFSALPPIFNGTSEVGFQILSSLIEDDRCDFSINIPEDTASLFGVSRFGSKLEIVHSSDAFPAADVAFRISQPIIHFDLIRLANSAPRNIFLFHDNIALDCLQIRCISPGVHSIWSLTAEHGDMLIFGSEFTRNIFRRRFFIPESTKTAVCHWSLSSPEYLLPPPNGYPGEGHPYALPDEGQAYCAVLGNQFYAHKGVEQTLPMLVSRFPNRHFECLGLSQSPAENIHAVESGILTWNSICRLIERADFVVVPTFYEGFGLPVLHSLSRGKVVLARESELLDELQAYWDGPGALLRYHTTDDLGDLLEQLFEGRINVPDLLNRQAEVNAGKNRQPARNWKTVGTELSGHILELAGKPADKCRRRLSHLVHPTEYEQLELYDRHLRHCIAQRDALQAEIGVYDENLRIAIRQRDELEQQLREMKKSKELWIEKEHIPENASGGRLPNLPMSRMRAALAKLQRQ